MPASAHRNLSPADVAERLGIHIQTARRLMKTGLSRKGRGIASSNLCSVAGSRRRLLRTSEADLLEFQDRQATGQVPARSRRRRVSRAAAASRHDYFGDL